MSIDPKMLFGPKMSRFMKICSYDQFPLISGPLNHHFVKKHGLGLNLVVSK